MYTVGLVSYSGMEEMDTRDPSPCETLKEARKYAHIMLRDGAFTAHIHGPNKLYELHSELLENCPCKSSGNHRRGR